MKQLLLIHRVLAVLLFLFLISAFLTDSAMAQVNTSFHNAPASERVVKNPYAGQAEAVQAGKTVYTRNCGACHGIAGRGTGNVPPLARGPAQRAGFTRAR